MGLTGDIPNRPRENTDITSLKPRRGLLPEDEVGSTLDQRLGEELVALVAQDGILEPEELAGVVAAVSVGAEGDGLAALAVAVLDVDVVQLEVGGLDAERGRLVVRQPVVLAQAAGDDRLVARVARRVRGVAVDGELRRPGADQHLLAVRPRVEEDALVRRVARRERVYRRLHRAVAPAALGYVQAPLRG